MPSFKQGTVILCLTFLKEAFFKIWFFGGQSKVKCTIYYFSMCLFSILEEYGKGYWNLLNILLKLLLRKD